MKKYILDLRVSENKQMAGSFVLLKLQSDTPLPEMKPGQFAEIRIDDTPSTMLRRPISINMVDYEQRSIWFLIQMIGDGTRRLGRLIPGDVVNVLLPLGNGFTFPTNKQDRLLLVGGGVGTAPMLYFGKKLSEAGIRPTFLLGARTASALLQIEDFQQYGTVCVTTEDGTAGEKGFVTQHSILQTEDFDHIYVCGPKPMMQAVAKYASARHIDCEVSLENKMACGLGACLCCVEDTQDGNLCVCKDGPVFNINRLKWQI